MVKLAIKVPKRRVGLETGRVERGKPREIEIQILVGESLETKDKGPKEHVSVR